MSAAASTPPFAPDIWSQSLPKARTGKPGVSTVFIASAVFIVAFIAGIALFILYCYIKQKDLWQVAGAPYAIAAEAPSTAGVTAAFTTVGAFGLMVVVELALAFIKKKKGTTPTKPLTDDDKAAIADSVKDAETTTANAEAQAEPGSNQATGSIGGNNATGDYDESDGSLGEQFGGELNGGAEGLDPDDQFEIEMDEAPVVE
jgi:hypothetical protein